MPLYFIFKEKKKPWKIHATKWSFIYYKSSVFALGDICFPHLQKFNHFLIKKKKKLQGYSHQHNKSLYTTKKKKKKSPRTLEQSPRRICSWHTVQTRSDDKSTLLCQLLYQPVGGDASMKEQRKRRKKGGYFPTTARPLLQANVALRSSRLERTLPCRESDACWDMLENDDCCLATLRDMWKSEVHCWRTRGRACCVQDHLLK